jgi:2-desacetyl-2-hydroxyethyl bacteriochlorophyllide A dehydrogenase
MLSRRLVCTAVRQVAWQPFEIPDSPGPHQVIIESACSLISAGTEVAVYSGSHIGFTIPNPPDWLKFPTGLGYALAGIVQAVGDGVEEYAVGDRALALKQHADWAMCDARTDTIHRLPPGVTLEQGALARLGAISLVGVRQGSVTLGETVVVLGLGLVGQFAARLCHLAGARPVIGVDRIPGRLEIAAASGVLDLNTEGVDVARAVKDITRGRMAEVVIEATGNPQLMPTALDLAAEGGRVVLLGSLRGKIEIDAYSTVHRKGITLLGAHERLSVHPHTSRDPWTRQRNLDLVLTFFADGSLKDEGLISHHIQPDDIQATYEGLIGHPEDYLGVLIQWRHQ